MTLAMKLALSPLLIAQAVAARRRALVMPEADGPRDGVHGIGNRQPLRLLIAGDSSAAGVGVANQDVALAGHLVRTLHASLHRPIHWTLRARTGLTTRQLHALLEADDALPAADIAVMSPASTTSPPCCRRAAPSRTAPHWPTGCSRAASGTWRSPRCRRSARSRCCPNRCAA